MRKPASQFHIGKMLMENGSTFSRTQGELPLRSYLIMQELSKTDLDMLLFVILPEQYCIPSILKEKQKKS